MEAAIQAEQRKYPDCEIKPAGIFYYNIKDPMIQKEMESDLELINPELLKKLKMNGLVLSDKDIIAKMDKTTVSLPLSYNKSGTLRKGASVATEEEFAALGKFVKQKIENVKEAIYNGNVEASPYELKDRNACTYCPYQGVCGFEKKIPGYEFRRIKQFTDNEIWKMLTGEED